MSDTSGMNTTPPPVVDASVAEPLPSDLGIDFNDPAMANDPDMKVFADIFADPNSEASRMVTRAMPTPQSTSGAQAAQQGAQEPLIPPPPAPLVPPTADAQPDASIPTPVAPDGPLIPDAFLPPPVAPTATAPEPVAPVAPVAPSSYEVTLPDGTAMTLTPEDMAGLVGLNQWAAGLTEQQRAAMTAVEQGQAAAIPLAELQRYQQWVASQTPAAPASPTIPPPPAVPAFDPSSFEDPHAAAAVGALNTQLAQLQAQLAEVSARPDPAAVVTQYAAQQNKLDRDTRIINDVSAAYAQERQLSPAELEAVQNTATQHRMLGRHAATAITPEQFAHAVRLTLDEAAYANPTVRAKLIADEVAAQLDTARTQLSAVDAKKARAASLASVPSAAVTTPPRDPNHRPSQQELENDIASFIRDSGEAALN